MKPIANPIRTTIVWGVTGGLAYIPLCFALSFVVYWPLSFHLSLSALLAAYGVLMSRWAQQPLRSIFFPLVLLFVAAFCLRSTNTFLFTAIGVLSWIRSGICFKNESILKRLAAEISLGLGTGLLVSGAVPAVDLVWALGVWLFFLIQALYFVLFGYGRKRETKIEVDPFERAKMAAETILSRWAL
jgi:hypothetical protein